MGDIIAPEGSPLSVAAIGVADMEASLRFYRDLIGLTTQDEVRWSGSAFERLWHLPKGSTASAVFLALPDYPVGRVLLLEFDAGHREEIRDADTARAYGLVNLNFYTDDIVADTKMLIGNGFRFWSEPTGYEMSEKAGAPIEVIFDGPDTVSINLVELATTDPTTRVGQMRAYVDKHGRTPTGFTPVVTTSHCVKDIDKATEFYKTVLKSGVLIDEIMDRNEQNHFLRLPEGSRTAVRFIQGNDMFGKVALSMPLNYQCDDLVPRAHAPNIGYIAQMFEVSDLDYAEQASREVGAPFYAARDVYDIPGLGPVEAFTVRNPGSGALQVIFKT
jgi:catechol 2,3-dioxygenase-like lactoylglutathione lyase family enzyme